MHSDTHFHWEVHIIPPHAHTHTHTHTHVYTCTHTCNDIWQRERSSHLWWFFPWWGTPFVCHAVWTKESRWLWWRNILVCTDTVTWLAFCNHNTSRLTEGFMLYTYMYTGCHLYHSTAGWQRGSCYTQAACTVHPAVKGIWPQDVLTARLTEGSYRLPALFTCSQPCLHNHLATAKL